MIINELVHCLTTIMVMILSEFLTFYQVFLLPQVKRSLIISNKLVYTSCLRSCRTTYEIRKVQDNVKTSWKYTLVLILPPPPKRIVNTSQRLLENRNWTFPVVHYFTWKLEFFSNIFSLLVSRNSFLLLTHPRSL